MILKQYEKLVLFMLLVFSIFCFSQQWNYWHEETIIDNTQTENAVAAAKKYLSHYSIVPFMWGALHEIVASYNDVISMDSTRISAQFGHKI